MRKKPPTPTPLASKPEPHVSPVKSQNDHTKDLFLHARSFHLAAKKLAGTLDFGSSPFAEFDVLPVISLYRHALELHLKAIVLGEGGNFLAMKPDPISVSNSHSVSWLAQFVCQIVTAVGWEKEFRCEGVETLADLKTMVATVNSVDPGMYVFRSLLPSPGMVFKIGRLRWRFGRGRWPRFRSHTPTAMDSRTWWVAHSTRWKSGASRVTRCRSCAVTTTTLPAPPDRCSNDWV